MGQALAPNLIEIFKHLSKVFENFVAGKFDNFLEGNSLLPPSQFSYCRGLRTCDALLTLSHQLQVALDGVWKEGLFSWTSLLHLMGLVTAVFCIS